MRVPLELAAPPPEAATPADWHLLTVKEIASACQLSEKAVRRAIDDGELAAVKLRSRLRVTPPDFEAWIAAQRQQRTTGAVPSSPQRLSRRAPEGTFRALAQADTNLGATR
jgi:excisionase family DNA binding protein